jgi:hypothetical protein
VLEPIEFKKLLSLLCLIIYTLIAKSFKDPKADLFQYAPEVVHAWLSKNFFSQPGCSGVKVENFGDVICGLLA